MAVVGNLATFMSVNSQGLTSGLASARKSFMGFGSTIGSFAGMASGVGLAIGGIAAAAKGLSAIKGGFDSAFEMEQTEVAFGVLFGNTETAKAVLADLGKFAASTPFELPELTAAGRSLAAFGVSAGDITPQLRMIGDVASGIGQPIGEIAEIYGKARVSGRLFGEDINQLTGRGIPIIGELAKQFGVSESEVKKLVEQGKVGFPNLEKAFQSMTGEGGKFEGMMAKQSATMAGLMSTLRDNIGTGMRDIATGMLQGMDFTGILTGITAGMEQLSPVFKQVGAVVGEAFGSIKSLLSSIFGASQTTFADIADFMLDAAILAEFAFTNIGTIATVAWDTVKLGALGFWNDFAFMFTDQFPAVFNWWADNFTSGMFTALDYTLTLFINLGKNIRALWQGVLDFMSGKGFNVDWTPMLEGAVNTMKSFDLPERVLSGAEMQMQAGIQTMTDGLLNDAGAMLQQRRGELLGDGSAAISLEAGDGTGTAGVGGIGGKATGELKGPAALQAGSSDAFSAVLAAMRGDSKDPNAEVAKNTKESLAEQKRHTSLMKKQAAAPIIEFVTGTV